MGTVGEPRLSDIAVVIPAFNAERYLDQTLDAVSRQTIATWRCVVVDDGSSDATAEVARRFAASDKRFTVVSQPNQGVAAARNRGAAVSDSEFLMFLDADDMPVDNALERLRGCLERNPDAPAAHGMATVVDELGRPSNFEGYEQRFGRVRISGSLFGRVEHVADTAKTGFDTLILRNPITTPGQVLLRRERFDGSGGFDSTVQPAEDWDFWLRLSQTGSLAFLPEPVIHYRKHDAGASAGLSSMRCSELEVRHRLICRSGPTAHPTETLARLALRRTEALRVRERLRAGFTKLVEDPHAASREIVRAGSSLREVALSFAPCDWLGRFGPEPVDDVSVMLVSTASNIGGMERVVCGLARRLPDHGHRCCTYLPAEPPNPALLEWCRNQGVDAVADASVVDAGRSHSPGTSRRLMKLIKRVDPAVVNLHYGDNFVSLWDIVAARCSGLRRRVVVSVNHPTPWTRANRRKRVMTALGARLVHAVTTISTATQEVLQQAPIPSSRIHLIPCGIAIPPTFVSTTHARELLGVPDDVLVIGCVARLVDYKRIDLLIEAVDTPELAGAVLLVGGEGPQRSELESLAASTRHVDVRLVGRIEDVNDLLAASDIFALPSRLEGFGLVYVEAAMHGVPSVATRVGGVPDAVVDGETGLLVEVDDLDGLRRAIIRLCSDEPLRRRLGEAARRRAHTELSEGTMAARFAELFCRLS